MAEKCGVKLLIDWFAVQSFEICKHVDQGCGAEFYCSQSAATGVEGGVDDLLEHLCQHHFQVFECLSSIY